MRLFEHRTQFPTTSTVTPIDDESTPSGAVSSAIEFRKASFVGSIVSQDEAHTVMVKITTPVGISLGLSLGCELGTEVSALVALPSDDFDDFDDFFELLSFFVSFDALDDFFELLSSSFLLFFMALLLLLSLF